MKRIGIDARLINQTGVGRYTRNLLIHLEKLLDDETELYVYMLPEDEDTISFKNKNIHIKHANFSWHSMSEQSGFWLRLMMDNLDLMHFTYFSHPILYRRPFVITIHDLIPLMHATGKASTKHPIVYKVKHRGYRKALSSGIKRAQAIITPTQTVKDNIEKVFGPKHLSKVHVTYEGVGSDLLRFKPNKTSPQKKPYFLYVGNFYPHKNVEKLVEAFARVKDDVQLVLVGPEDFFSRNIHTAIREHNQKGRVILKHNLSDKELVTHYAHALALVHPTQAEGFGLQLLEASYFECPIIASNIPIFNEVLGDKFISFDQNDIYDIASKLSGFVKKPQKKFLSKSEMKNRFSFSEMTKQTYDIYSEILGA